MISKEDTDDLIFHELIAIIKERYIQNNQTLEDIERSNKYGDEQSGIDSTYCRT